MAAVLPEFIDKEPSWFLRNRSNIEHGRAQHDFWRRNTLTVTPQWQTGMRGLVEHLLALHYTMNAWPEQKGEFSLRGGALIIAPINTHELWRIDFFGNHIESIEKIDHGERPDHASNKKTQHTLFEYLRSGDFVVHQDHGIGIWRGIQKETQGDYFLIEYRGPKGGEADTLLVPVSESHRITPYIGFRTPPVSRLGTPLWKKTLKKTKDDAVAFAKKLLTIYAERSVVTRTPIRIVPEIEAQLASSFPHTETDAQKRVLDEITKDLAGPAPMDRILIGDVGFGKTEIALRASVRVAASGKQVAVLAPTTLLAEQHYRTWSERLKDFPLAVRRLSRLDDKANEKKSIEEIARGTVDIVIGTHRLLSKDVVFKNLGLLVVDEEQRFGVKAKEHLKDLKKDIDVLTLSATPLPRTLSLALSRVKRMSVLDEAPEGRIAPQTFVLPYDTTLVKSAIEQEISHGGQIYFLQNRIGKIPTTLKELSVLLPSRKIGYIHGRMGEKKMIETMNQFRNKEIEILISTTIIENGIDLSDVNTLIVSDAIMYGLADLHQLRGRVGRGSQQSYAYFFYDRGKLPPKAGARLDVLEATQFLGAGSVIAEKDLEMRGAGNILGREQSGVAGRVGLNLYSQFLAEAVEKLRDYQ